MPSDVIGSPEAVIGEFVVGGGGEATFVEIDPLRFSYYAYDFLTGHFIGEVPARTVQFGGILNGAGSLTASIDIRDKQVQATSVASITVPNKSFLVVDYEGSPIWGGISQPRKYDVSDRKSVVSG